MSLPSVLIRKSTGEIIKHANYPREDMGIIEGLDPDLEWLVKVTPYDRPDYDSRIFLLNQIEEITVLPHDTYLHLNQYLITYTTTKRSNEDILQAIENAENNANEIIFNYTEQVKKLTMVLAAVIRTDKKLELTTEEEEVVEDLLGINTNFWKNHENKKIKRAQLELGEEPEIDAGWETGVITEVIEGVLDGKNNKS